MRFRSLLELAYMRQLEREGFVFGETASYETVKIPYRIGNGRKRTYVVDFLLGGTTLAAARPQGVLVEVKWSKRVNERTNRAKFAAARSYVAGLLPPLMFRVVTEADIETLTLKEAVGIEGVEWSDRTKRSRAFKRAGKR